VAGNLARNTLTMDVTGPTGPRSTPRASSLNEHAPEAPRRFRIHRCLGRGGFGEVYRATMSRDGGVTTEVAVKILAADLDPGSDAVVRLRDEGRLLGALSHPAILHVYDLVLLAGRVALVTEYVEGQDLHKVMFGAGAMSFRGLVESIGQVAEALHAAWTTESPYGGGPMHLVHRDVKPQNVRVGVHGQVKLLDFGIARAANVQREANTQTNLLLGSWPYLAPERLQEEEASPTPAIDVYALGCTLFEGLAGERLMEGRKLLELYRVVDEPDGFHKLIAERLPKAQKKAPAPVYQLLTSLLEVDPAARPTPHDIAQRCEDLAEALPGIGIRRWARERVWPTTEETEGPLSDYELSEGSLEVPSTRGFQLGATPVPQVRTVDPGNAGPVAAIPPPPPPPFVPGTPIPSPVRSTPAPVRASAARTTPMPSPPRDVAATPAPGGRGTPAPSPPRGAPAVVSPGRGGPRAGEEDAPPTPVVSRAPGAPAAAGPRAPAAARAATPAGAAPPRAPTPGPPKARPVKSSEESTVLMDSPVRVGAEPAVDLLGIRIDEPSEQPPTPAPAPPSALGMGLTVLLGVGALAVVSLVGLVGIGAWWWTSTPGSVATVEPAPAAPEPAAPEPATPEPAAPEPATPEPATPEPAAPEPAAPEPATAPAPAPPPPTPPKPAPAEPRPAPAPAPEPSAGAFAALEVRGDAAAVELRGEFGGFRPGTPLPPDGYAVWADFGEGLVDTGKATQAKPGSTIVVRCDAAAKACTVSP
jgi:serine/threonine protein kinase